MEQKKSSNFGFRGWMLILYQLISFLTFVVFTNYPMNILAQTGFYPEATTMSTFYLIGSIVAIVVQFILSSNIGKIKSIWKMSIFLGIAVLVFAVLEMVISPANATLWLIVYGLEVFLTAMQSIFAIGILIGQWFPRRVGTVMGVATLAFPIGMGIAGFCFAAPFFGKFGAAMETQMGEKVGALIASGMGEEQAQFLAGTSIAQSTTFSTYLPFLILGIIGLLIGIIFIRDYPEQVGAFRDNDKNMTPEIANKMMLEEIENKKTTVWKPLKSLACRDFWFAMLPIGLLLIFAIGVATQTNAIVGQYPELDYNIIMVIFAACGALGSYVLGLLDTKFGTKTAITITACLAVLAGIFGIISGPVTLVISLCFLGMFNGATSNYAVSLCVHYWRREDFPTVYSVFNPFISLFNSLGPVIISRLLFANGAPSNQLVFIACLIGGVIAFILIRLFSAKHVKEVDDKYREAAGKPLDDELAKRLQ